MSSVERAGVLKFWPVMRMLRMEQRAVARLAVGRCCIFAGGYRPAEGVADQIRLLASMPIENAAESWRRAQNSTSNSSISSGSDSAASFSAADTIRGRRRPDALLPGPAAPKGAEVDLRGRPRHGSRHLQDRGRSDLALPAQKGRDAVSRTSNASSSSIGSDFAGQMVLAMNSTSPSPRRTSANSPSWFPLLVNATATADDRCRDHSKTYLFSGIARGRGKTRHAR